MTTDEWDSLARCCGVPYDKRDITEDCQVEPIVAAMNALDEMKTARKALADLQKRYDKFAAQVDAVLPS